LDDLHSHTTYKPVLEEIPRPEDRGTNIKEVVREIVETIALALVIFLLVRLVAQNFRIEGSSMEPNLHNGQFLIVNKAVYYLHPPERGDVIVFQAPDSPRKDYIKRVVGLPGEEVEIVDGQVFVNGLRLEESYISEPGSRSWGPEVVGDFEYLVLGDNRRNSRDSTNWGMLDGNAIIGKGWICYWPPQDFGLVPHYSFVAG
jgi:signal peptidase I